MNAINELSAPVTSTMDPVDNLITAYSVETEELGVVGVVKAMTFHAGQRREEEIENQNPSAPTTKVYVVLEDHGFYVANAVEDSSRLNGIWLTHLQKVENLETFKLQVNREIDRTGEANRMIVAATTAV